MEVKKKFRKDGIELDDARQNSRKKKSREKDILPARQDFRGAGVSLVLTQEGPAILVRLAIQKTAGGTPAPQRVTGAR
jgi:hypothetical protein